MAGFLVSMHTSLLERLRGLLKLQMGATQVRMSTTIIPVVDIQQYLGVSKAVSGSVAVSSTGYKYMATVPTGKRWIVNTINVSVSSGTWTMLLIAIKQSGLDVAVMRAAASFTNYTLPTQNLVLNAGDQIGAYVDAYTGAGTLGGNVQVTEEDASL